jgi:hypothetical protein
MTAYLRRFVGTMQMVLNGDRGDVPGWVLITVMTAGLVTMLWTLANGTLQGMFTRALAAVTGP